MYVLVCLYVCTYMEFKVARSTVRHARIMMLARSGAAAFGRGLRPRPRHQAQAAPAPPAPLRRRLYHYLSIRVCRCSAASHARLLAPTGSGAAAFGHTGASGASLSAAFDFKGSRMILRNRVKGLGRLEYLRASSERHSGLA
jgi:hypothetical protein